MKRILKYTRAGSCLIVLVMLITGVIAIQSVCQDISVVRQETAERGFSNNTTVFGKQINDLFSSRMLVLQNLAECISMVDKTKVADLNSLLNAQSDEFSEIAIMDLKGNVLCGGDISETDLGDEGYQKKLSEGKCVLGTRTYTGSAGEELLLMYAPIIRKSQLAEILVASIDLENISLKLDAAGFVGNGCVCIMDSSGSYLVGSNNFDALLGEKESNHISHMGNCTYLKENQSITLLEETIERRHRITVQYRYAGTEYVSTYVPMNLNNWYLVAMAPITDISSGYRVIAIKTVVIIIIALAFLLISVVTFVLTILYNRKLAKENRLHQVLQRCDKAVSFKLNFKPHYLEFYGDLKSIIGTDHGPLSGEEVYDIYDWIHEDDLSIRGRLRQFYESDEEMFMTEVRIRNIRGTYGWYRIVGIMQRDHLHEKNQWFVGKIFNVDEQMREEKELVQRAENDLLTGVLNKKTMERRISLMLKNRGNKYVIFYMVDLDNFKNVNDTLGHIYGDQAIVETAQCLNKVFADQDCIGRLGGDEFAVCVSYQAFDEQGLYDFINKKAEKICQVNRRTYSDGASDVSITSSVGIAIAPNMGQDFESLYTKADRALYYSKEHGKNQYHIYTSEDN